MASDVANASRGSLEEEREPFTSALLSRNAPYLSELLEQQADGWRLEGLDTLFTKQRAAADNAGDGKLKLIFTKAMVTVLHDIDINFHVVDESDPDFTFLDIGCASGGFSAYVLTRNLQCIGAGITLPVEEGGHPWLLDGGIDERFELVWHNLHALDLGPVSSTPPKALQPFPFFGRTFHLVLLDGHHLRTQAENEYSRGNSDHERLVVGQLHIGLRCVRHGGTIVMKLSKIEFTDTARLLYILDQVAESLFVHKPTTTHKVRGTFYVIAKGVRKNSVLDRYITALQKCWYDLTFGGEDGGGSQTPRGLILVEAVPWDVLTSEANLNRVASLGRDVWKTQLGALIRQNKRYKWSARPSGAPGIRGKRGPNNA